MALDASRAAPAVDWLQSRTRELIVPLAEVMRRVPHGGTLVDLGCGQGLMLERILDTVDRAVGVDFDPRKLRMARQRLRDAQNLTLIEADLLVWMDTNAERFDTALLVDTLSSFEPADQDRVLIRAVSLLKPGGVLLLKIIDTTPTWKVDASRLLSGLVYRILRLSRSAQQRFWYRPATELAALLEHQGCTVTRLDLHDHHVIPHVLLVATTAKVP